MYDILHVDSNAQIPTIKKSYNELLKIHHPDKSTGSSDIFLKIHYAFGILRNCQSRTLYDLYSYGGLAEDPPFNPCSKRKRCNEDCRGESPTKKILVDCETEISIETLRPIFPKEKVLEIDLLVSLKQLYRGKLTRVRIKRRVTCDSCSSGDIWCGHCAGNGLDNDKSLCQLCQGTGLCTSHCPKCHGIPSKIEHKILTVQLEKGMVHKQKILMSGVGFHGENTSASDVIFRIILRRHKRFSVQNGGHDLHTSQKIDLNKAMSINIKQLDGRILKIPIPAAVAEKSEKHTIRVRGEGMPYHNSSTNQCGSLYIHFSIARFNGPSVKKMSF